VISADVLADNGYNAVALLGTDIQDDGILSMLEQGIEFLCICLDGDANKKAVALQKRLSLYFRCVSIKFLEKDIKNMEFDEFSDWRTQ
jgi:DNA primase